MILWLAVAACSVTIPGGTHLVELTSYYQHADPVRTEILYVDTAARYLTGPGTAEADSEGHPAAHRWRIDGEVVLTCGEIPVPDSWRVFSDGFESGNTAAWTTGTQPARRSSDEQE